MKRCFRWIVGLLFVLAVSIYLLTVALPLLFNPNDHKGLISDLVREQTGRELVIGGDIQLQVSPGLHVTCTLTKIRLSGNTLFPNSTFIESEEAKIELSLWPLLLQRRLHMPAIMADGVTLNLLRTKDGIGNWENLAAHGGIAKETAGETPAATTKQRQPSLTRFLPALTGLDLGKVHLSHINVRHDNRQSDRVIILKDLKIRSGRIWEEGQFPFEATFNLLLGNKKAIMHSADMTMQGNGTLFLKDPHLLLEDFRMKAVFKGRSLPKRGLKVAFSTNSDLHLRQQKMSIKDFSLSHGDATLQGSGTLEDLSSPRFNLSLRLPECSPPESILKQLQAALPILQNDEPVTHVSAELLVKGDMELAEISDLTIMADETRVTGSIKVKDLRNPAYEAIIHVNHLDLDRYAPPKREAPPETDVEQTTATPMADSPQTEAAPPVIPVPFLRSLPLQLDLQLDSLKVGGAQLSQVQITLSGNDGIIQVAPLTARLYGGSMNVEATLDVTGDLPQIHLRPSIKQVQLAPLFQGMMGREEVTGTALIQADIRSSGLSRDDLLNHIKGTLQFEILNGEIKAVTIMPVIRTTLALHRKEAAPPLTGDGATGFDRLTGTGILEDGILYNDDFMATSESMQMTGAGEIDLTSQQIDLMLYISLPPDLAQDKDMGLTELGGRIIPYKIFGPLTDLQQEADIEKLLPTESRPETLKKLEEQQSEAAPARKKQETKGD